MRPIDAVALSEGIELYRQSTDQSEACRQWAVGYNAGLDRALRSIAEAKTIAPPPNNPLTTKELQEMGCEWVWIKPLIPLYNMVEGYYIKKPCASTLDRFCCGFPDVVPWSKVRYLFYSEYGEKWIAYRNKP